MKMDKRYLMSDKVLEATFVVNKYEGKCKKCKDHVKMSTVYEKDSVCAECQFNIPRKKRKGN